MICKLPRKTNSEGFQEGPCVGCPVRRGIPLFPAYINQTFIPLLFFRMIQDSLHKYDQIIDQAPHFFEIRRRRKVIQQGGLFFASQLKVNLVPSFSFHCCCWLHKHGKSAGILRRWLRVIRANRIIGKDTALCRQRQARQRGRFC